MDKADVIYIYLTIYTYIYTHMEYTIEYYSALKMKEILSFEII